MHSAKFHILNANQYKPLTGIELTDRQTSAVPISTITITSLVSVSVQVDLSSTMNPFDRCVPLYQNT